MSDQKIVNLSYLNEVTGGDPEMMKEFIHMFIDQIPEFSNGLKNFLSEKKYKELGELAHKAKSSVLTFGMDELGVQLKMLQLKTQKLEDIETYPEYVNLFISQITQAETELKVELKTIN